MKPATGRLHDWRSRFLKKSVKQEKKNWKAPQILTEIFLALLITVFLLSVQSYTEISVMKKNLFFILCGGYAVIMIMIFAEELLSGRHSWRQLFDQCKPSSFTQYFVLAYLGFTVLSACLSDYPQSAWLGGTRGEGVLTILLYGICFFGVCKFGVPKRWMMYLFGGAVTLFSILCILQLFGLNPFGLYPGEYNYYDGYKAYASAYLGTIGNVDFVASFLCIAIPLFWIYLVRAKEKQRFYLLIPLTLATFVLLRMWVLAGLVGVFGGGVILLPVALGLSKKHKLFYWIGCGICAVGGLLALYLLDFGGGMLQELHLLLHGQISDTFGSGRFYIWGSVLERVPQNFFFGAGPDTMSYAEIEPFKRYDEELDLMIHGLIDVAHNEYLNVLYHQGIFAILAYLGALGSAFVQWIKNNRSLEALLFGGAVLCYGIQAFFGISAFLVAPFFWLCFGLLEGHQQKTCKKRIDNLKKVQHKGVL